MGFKMRKIFNYFSIIALFVSSVLFFLLSLLTGVFLYTNPTIYSGEIVLIEPMKDNPKITDIIIAIALLVLSYLSYLGAKKLCKRNKS